MKIAIISDLHLGFRQYGSIEREQDFYDQFSTVCKEISKESPDIVIIAGDLFDKPNPSPAAINAYREGIGYLNSDVICSIKGNHTMIQREGHYSIDDFFGEDEFEGYYYLDDSSFNSRLFSLETNYDMEFRKYKNTNIQIDGITYRTNSELDEFFQQQKEMAEQCSEKFYNILVVHQAFKEFCGFTSEELSIEDIVYEPYNVIICGHIHSRFDTILPNGTKFIQPGSIERMNTTEALDEQRNGKGFYLLDTETDKYEFHKVECPRKFFLGNIKIKDRESFQKHVEDTKNEVKKLKVPPIISYTYDNYDMNMDEIRENIKGLDENILLNKTHIDDRSQEDIVVEITDNEIPTIIESLKMYGKESGLSTNEIGLVVDLYKNPEDSENIIESYFYKNKIEKKKEEEIDTEIEEIIRYFKEE